MIYTSSHVLLLLSNKILGSGKRCTLVNCRGSLHFASFYFDTATLVDTKSKLTLQSNNYLPNAQQLFVRFQAELFPEGNPAITKIAFHA